MYIILLNKLRNDQNSCSRRSGTGWQYGLPKWYEIVKRLGTPGLDTRTAHDIMHFLLLVSLETHVMEKSQVGIGEKKVSVDIAVWQHRQTFFSSWSLWKAVFSTVKQKVFWTS